MADIVDRIKAEEIRWLKLHVVDPEGFIRGFGINARILSERPIKEGFESSTLSLAYGKEREELIAVPIENTYALIPWEDRSARLLAYITTKDGAAYSKDPYHALKRALAGLDALGYSFRASQRIEFYLTDNITVDRTGVKRGPSATVDGREMPWNPTARFVENRSSVTVPFDMYGILREQIGDVLNIYFATPANNNGHSVGVGQQYIEIGVGVGEQVAFDFINTRFAAKMVAMLNGAYATFMPYPIKGEKPSFWELNIEVWKGKERDDDATLYFIGGILEHLESLALFTNPTTNSYKGLRFYPKYHVASPYSSSAVWVKDRKGKNVITLTFPDSSANPYLALAAIIGAGIDGIKKKLAPEVVEDNPAKMGSKERARAHIKEMPSSLGEAIKALNSDNNYLKGILTPELLAIYLEKKLIDERENATSPTHYELMKYGEL